MAIQRKLEPVDPGQVLKQSHDQFSSSLRTVSTQGPMPRAWDWCETDYNATTCLPEKTTYYRYNEYEENQILFDNQTTATLQNKYIKLYMEQDKYTYLLWFRLDGSGTAPSLDDAEAIAIDITTGDSSELISNIFAITVNNLLNDLFVAKFNSGTNMVTLLHRRQGPTTGAHAGSTSVTVNNLNNGTEKVVGIVVYEYDANNNLIRAK